MTAITFDTHHFIKKLVKAGMPEKQAEVLAEEQARIINEKLATKQDLTDLRHELKRDMQELEYRLIIKIGGMLALAVAITVSLLKVIA